MQIDVGNYVETYDSKDNPIYTRTVTVSVCERYIQCIYDYDHSAIIHVYTTYGKLIDSSFYSSCSYGSINSILLQEPDESDILKWRRQLDKLGSETKSFKYRELC